MPFTLAGYSESQDSANLALIAALADQHLTVAGDDLRIPEFAPNLIGTYVFGPNVTRAQLQAPSLRRIVNQELMPIQRLALPGTPHAGLFHFDSPIALLPDENLNALAAEDGAGATRATVLVFLADGPVAPVSGDIHTVRVTGTTTLVVNAWTNGTLVFDQALPPGTYAIVGATFRSTNLQAFRFVFVGGSIRPGGIGAQAVGDVIVRGQRFGGWGEWGQFSHTTPPTVDYLANVADVAETGEIDLIKVA